MKLRLMTMSAVSVCVLLGLVSSAGANTPIKPTSSQLKATSSAPVEGPSWLKYPLNSAWVYENKNFPNKPTVGAAVQQTTSIKDFQQATNSGLTALYSYGGDIELLSTTNPWAPATDGKSVCSQAACLSAFYLPKLPKGAKINHVTAGYKRAFPTLHIMPIIDARINSLGLYDDGTIAKTKKPYAQAMDSLNKTQAETLADNVANQICGDPNAAGAQFDIEPFSISSKTSGQYYFYNRISSDFAGKTDLNAGCVDQANGYPNGRAFSVFTFAGAINPTVAQVLNQYHNGYVVDSLYDLGDPQAIKAGKVASSPSDYGNYVSEEISSMVGAANRYGVQFQFAVAGAASAHEFVRMQPEFSQNYHQKLQPAAFMSEYLDQITQSPNYICLMNGLGTVTGTCNGENNTAWNYARRLYLGNAMWAFDTKMPWSPCKSAPNLKAHMVCPHKKENNLYFPATYNPEKDPNLIAALNGLFKK